MQIEDKILQGTLDVFRIKGIKFTMDDLAKHLGISKRTLYESVKSKEKLLIDSVDTVFDLIKKLEIEIYENNDLNDIEKLKNLITVLPKGLGSISYNRMFEVNKYYPKVYEKMMMRVDSGWELTLDLLEECMNKGLIKKTNPLLVKHMIVACVNELLQNDFLYRENMDYSECYKEVINIIFLGIEMK